MKKGKNGQDSQPQMINTKVIEQEYMEHLDSDTDEIYWVKEAIKALSPVQRKIYITYLETGTYSKTAKIFRVTLPTVREYVKKLTASIREYVCNHL